SCPSGAALCRRADLGDDALQHGGCFGTVELGFGIEHDAVGQHRFDEGFDVVGDHVVAPVGGCPGLGAAHQRQCAAHGGAQGDLGGVTGGLGEGGDVAEHGGVHVHTGGEGGHIGHGTGGDHRGQARGAVLHGGAGEDLHSGVLIRV